MRASKPPPVNDHEENLNLSPASTTASNSKTSMSNSSGHRNYDGKNTAGKKNRNKKSDTASNQKSVDCVIDVSFVFLFFSIPFLMNSSNI